MNKIIINTHKWYSFSFFYFISFFFCRDLKTVFGNKSNHEAYFNFIISFRLANFACINVNFEYNKHLFK